MQYPLFNVVRKPELGLYQFNSKSAKRLSHVLTLTYRSPHKWLINDRSRLGSKVQGVGCICVKSAFGRNVGNHTCVSCATEGVLKIGKRDRKKMTKCHTSDSGKNALSIGESVGRSITGRKEMCGSGRESVGARQKKKMNKLCKLDFRICKCRAIIRSPEKKTFIFQLTWRRRVNLLFL